MVRVLAVVAVLVAGAAFVWRVSQEPVTKRAPRPVAPDPERMIAKRLPRDEQLRAEALPAVLEPLRALAVPKLPPEAGDWLAEHPEDGQSLAGHQADCQPVPGKVVYLVPIFPKQLQPGEVSEAKLRGVVGKLAPLLRAHFQLEVKVLAPLDEKKASKSEREGQIGRQWWTKDILEALLAVRPADAAAVMAVTAVDLYPDPTWNFVFGEATYEQRVGVMSLARTGDLETEPDLVLTRTYQTGMHEIGHMLQMHHCIAWECPMNGCNHQDESDSRPLEPCPHCLAKLMRATGLDPMKRLVELRAAFEEAGLLRGVDEIDKELAAMRGAGDGG